MLAIFDRKRSEGPVYLHTHWRPTRTNLPAAVLVATVVAPLLYIVASWATIDPELWRHLYDTQLQRLITNTIVLCAGVSVGVVVLGVSLAWLTSYCEFPGRRWLDWALVLPLAVPAYVLAFVMLGLLDFAGPLQLLMAQWVGADYRAIDPRHPLLVVLVMTLVFYPYVYLLTRSVFIQQGTSLMEASRSLGCGSFATFWRVTLPVVRPALVAGTALALMETLADFGAVSIFNYDTFTTAIYKSWFGFFDLKTAAQLSSLLLLFVLLGLLAERHGRGGARSVDDGVAGQQRRIVLTGVRAGLASLYAGVVFFAAFVLPILQLGWWAMAAGWTAALDLRYLSLLGNSVMLAAAAALVTVLIALLSAPLRARPARPWWWELGNLGYAVPGSVLAVGVMLLFADLDRVVWLPLGNVMGVAVTPLVGGLAALLFAYWIRFFAVATGPIDASVARIRPALLEAARLLGSDGVNLLRRVYVPLLRPGVMAAALLVFVDVLKEMPATLLLRPYGWDTLAVQIYGLTAEGEWQRAALPALTLLVAGLPPVYLLMKRAER